MLQAAYLVVVCLDKCIIMYLCNKLANKSCPQSRSFQKRWTFDALCGPGPWLKLKNEDSSVDICVCLRRTPFSEFLQTVNTYWILMSCGWGQLLRNTSLKNENSVLVSFKACISSLDHKKEVPYSFSDLGWGFQTYNTNNSLWLIQVFWSHKIDLLEEQTNKMMCYWMQLNWRARSVWFVNDWFGWKVFIEKIRLRRMAYVEVS